MPATLFDIQKKYGESVYPLYKEQMHEPYMENEKGEGYQGVVLYDELEDKVQCAECGEWFKNMGQHVAKGHKISAREYKTKQGLFQITPLCTPSHSKIQRERMKNRMINNPEKMGGLFTSKRTKQYQKTITISDHRERAEKSRNTSQFKNNNGLCDAQIVARLEIVRSMAKKGDISSGDLYRFDLPLHKVLHYRFGSLEKACEFYNISVSKKGKYEDAELIAILRGWVLKYKKIPVAQDDDFRNHINPFYRVFGSWERAKMMAGLEQLLQEINENKTTTNNKI